MIQVLPARESIAQWVKVCTLTDIQPNTGVCALVEGEQIAIFRVNNEVYALSNYDPFSKAFVLSRGLVGDRNGILKVASPIYKQNFSLLTGVCLDDKTVVVPTFPTQIIEGEVHIGLW